MMIFFTLIAWRNWFKMLQCLAAWFKFQISAYTAKYKLKNIKYVQFVILKKSKLLQHTFLIKKV